MHRFKNILIVLDRASPFDDSLRHGQALAKRDGARLTLAVCLQEFGDDSGWQELRDVYVEGLRHRLEHIADSLRQQSIDCTVLLLFGRPFLEVTVQVLHGGHDLVIKTAQSAGTLKPMLFGSTDMHLLRKCPCPVWVLPPDHQTSAGIVLAAVDTASTAAESAVLNDMIIETALTMAGSGDTAVHVAHAWSVSRFRSFLQTPWLNAAGSEYAARVEEQSQQYRRLFDDFVARHRIAIEKLEEHYLEGEPEDVIPALARDLGADVIVMGTAGRSGVPGLLIGNTAETIVNQVECSVLAIKPPGFTTPVSL